MDFKKFLEKINEVEKEEKEEKPAIVQTPEQKPVEQDEQPAVDPKTPFSQRLEGLGKGWRFKVDYNGSDPQGTRWEMEIRGNKGQRYHTQGNSYSGTLNVLVQQMRNQGIQI